MARALYSLLWFALLPLIPLRLWWRARRQPAYRAHWGERFGRYGARPDGPLIWIHAVSVGETRAARPLIDALLAQHPGFAILLTQMTPTGRDTATELFGPRVTCAYLPYDLPFTVARFLDHFRPRLGVLMETELWPNLIAAATARGVPLALVNARLSEKSAAGYARVAPLARPALQGLRAIAAQTETDAQRLRTLGAHAVQVLGNMKFDFVAPAAQLALAQALRARIGTRTVLLAASTREGEEALLLDAYAAAGFEPTVLLAIVPRHPQRFDEVAALVAQRGLALQRRSDGAPLAPATRVWLGDSMGELFAYYGACDVAFVGGSLLPLGGQNLIEACSVGAPVLVGPHTFNFAQVSEDAIAAGAARRVADAAALMREAQRLLADPDTCAAMAQAGRAFAERNRGATARTIALVEALLASR